MSMDLIGIDYYIKKLEELEKENEKLREWQFTSDDLLYKETLKKENNQLKRELRNTNETLKTVLSAYSKLRKSKEQVELDSIIEQINTPKPRVELREDETEESQKPTNPTKIKQKLKGWFKYA